MIGRRRWPLVAIGFNRPKVSIGRTDRLMRLIAPSGHAACCGRLPSSPSSLVPKTVVPGFVLSGRGLRLEPWIADNAAVPEAQCP
jgi:hypothetical protein